MPAPAPKKTRYFARSKNFAKHLNRLSSDGGKQKPWELNYEASERGRVDRVSGRPARKPSDDHRAFGRLPGMPGGTRTHRRAARRNQLHSGPGTRGRLRPTSVAADFSALAGKARALVGLPFQ